MTRSGDLHELQILDTQLDQYKSRLKVIAKTLADDSELRKTESAFLKAEKNKMKAENELKMAEKRVKDQRLKIKSTNAKLYGGKITNPKELKDLQDESEALSRYLSILEDRQLEKMFELDDVSEKFRTAKQNLEFSKQSTRSLQKELTKERENIEQEVIKLEARRQSFITLIPVEDLVLYEKLRKQGHGLAVTKVQNRSCSACGATLSAALHQSARSPNQITLCSTCGRIICG